MSCVVCAVSLATWLLLTGVPARCVVLRVRRPGPSASHSPVCPLGALLCVCGVLGHLAPVHRGARWVCCVACALSWATWLLFIVVPARCVVLRVRCPGPLGSCSPVCPLGVLCCMYGVLGHLAPVRRCACSVCCVACAVFWATWLLFTGVPVPCVVLRVRCPGPLGSCSSVSLPGTLCCVCGVLGHLAPIHRCACSVCSVVLRVRCPETLCSCSPVCSLRVLRWVCCRALTRPSGRQLFRSRQGLGMLRAHTRASGRWLFRSRQGLGWLPGAHLFVRTAAGVAWHLSSCRSSLRVVPAFRFCSTRPALSLAPVPVP